jgi:fumarate reductase subunit C
VKPYRRPISRTWWLENPRYLLFMLRDASSIFVALWVVLLLVQLAQLGQGPQVYQRFIDDVVRSPLGIAFGLVTLAFALLHSVTWLQLAGVVQVVTVGQRRLPANYVVAGALVGWLVASVVVAAVVLFV